MMTYQKTNNISSIELKPSLPAIGSVIWLHGLGADGHDFEPIVPELNLPASLPLRFIFPHAPIRPVTINNGFAMRAWFDIYSMNINQRIDEEGITESVNMVRNLIEHEKSLGIPTKNIVLAGFSQGSVIALSTGLSYPEPLAGVIALSGFLPNAEQIIANVREYNKSLPIFIAHGNQDLVVPCMLGQITADVLKRAGYPVTWKEYAMAHSLCGNEVQDIARWLTDRAFVM
jgi:phospholipase/carboxylesterase